MVLAITPLLLSGCAGNYMADYGIVVSVVQESTSNEVTVKVYNNPYQVYGLTCGTLIIHTGPNTKYTIGDTIRFVK